HFLVGALPGQPHQRGQTACSRNSPRAQPRCHCLAPGSLNAAKKSNLPRCTVPTLTQQTRCSQSHHGHGSPPSPIGLSNAQVRSAVCRQRCGILRTKEPPTTSPLSQKESRSIRPTNHPRLNDRKKFLESRKTANLMPSTEVTANAVNQDLSRTQRIMRGKMI